MLERIKFYLPQVYKNDPLAHAFLQGVETYTDEIQRFIRMKFDQLCVGTSSGEGIAEWEKELAISPANTKLEVRRAIIKARLMRPPAMTPERLTAIANQFTYTNTAQVVHVKKSYVLEIHVPMDDVISSRDMLNEVYEAKPAHLVLYLMIELAIQVEIRYAAEITAMVDASFCFWNRGAAAYVRRDGKYKRNASVRRNRLDPDELYRVRQHLISEMRQGMESSYLVAVKPQIDSFCQSEVAVPVLQSRGAEMFLESETALQIPSAVKTESTPTVDASHWTNHRMVNMRNRTQARDGTHKRGRKYVQDGLVNLACTCVIIKNGKSGRLENL